MVASGGFSLAEPASGGGSFRSPLGISLENIVKRYGGVLALDGVTLAISPGTIHGLVGENGAGKSTLGRIVSGAVVADSGTIAVDGRPAFIRSPRDALRLGIASVHQETALVPALSILDNVFLGVEPGRAGLVSRADERNAYGRLAAAIRFDLPPGTLVETLSVGDRQSVEILRALARRARLIVMDEPTAALSRREADRLLAVCRDLRARGVTILFISHDLHDVLAIADTVTIMRDGSVVRTAPADAETAETLVIGMLGRTTAAAFPERRPPDAVAPVVLSVRGLSRPPAFADISFTVRAGEIVGLAGMLGSGRTAVARAVFGADRAEAGSVEVSGMGAARRTPRRSIRRGMALLPESRKEQGLVMIRPVRENVSLAHLDVVAPRGIVSSARERSAVGRILARVGARMASDRLPASALSGGNQQKAAIAKWLLKPPALLIADEPTRGIDVGARLGVYGLLRDLAAGGMGIVLISSDVEEIVGLAHRVLVLRRGRLVAEFAGGDITAAAVLGAAAGDAPDEAAE